VDEDEDEATLIARLLKSFLGRARYLISFAEHFDTTGGAVVP